MKYRVQVDLRKPPPEESFVPSGGPEPTVQDLPANEALEKVYLRLRDEVASAVVRRDASQHVWERKGYKHLVRREGREQILELRLSQSGSLVRRVYERMGGPDQSLADLFERGMSGLEEDAARFARWPGYELRFARYATEEGRLTRVRMGRASFHADFGRVVITAL